MDESYEFQEPRASIVSPTARMCEVIAVMRRRGARSAPKPFEVDYVYLNRKAAKPCTSNYISKCLTS
jgi:hypothetical protein